MWEYALSSYSRIKKAFGDFMQVSQCPQLVTTNFLSTFQATSSNTVSDIFSGEYSSYKASGLSIFTDASSIEVWCISGKYTLEKLNAGNAIDE